MRSLVVFASLASLVSLTAIASADPSDAITARSVTREPSRYVAVGAIGGVNADLFTLGASLDGGQQLGDTTLWLHGRASLGVAEELFEHTTSSRFEQLRAGVEERPCAIRGQLCAMLGVDLGVERVAWTGHDSDWYGGSTETMDRTTDVTRPVAVPRIGFDAGGTHFRWRWGVEMPLAVSGIEGVNVSSSVAYRF